MVLSSKRGFKGERLFAFLGALALLVLGGAIFLTLVPACGLWWLNSIWLFGNCAGVSIELHSPQARADAQARERVALEHEIVALERDLGRLRCAPAAPQTPVKDSKAPDPPVEEPDQETEAAQCEPSETAVQTTEVVFVFDTSGSMNYSIDLPAELDREMTRLYNELLNEQERAAAGDWTAAPRLLQRQLEYDDAVARAESYPGSRRMQVAREVMVNAIESAPPDVSLGLVSFNDCDVRRHGRFAPDQRPQLVRAVNELRDKDSTPLAKAIGAATMALQGGDTQDEPVNIVVLSDGQDSCRGDPCAAARQAKQSKPGLVINVVDLSAVGDLKCVSDSTGGFFRRHNEGVSISDLSRAMREAAGYEGEGLCRE